MSVFSRFLPSLLNVFTTRSPDIQAQAADPPTLSAQEPPTPEMVTTRRQSGNKVVAAFTNDGEAEVDGVNKDEVPAELLSPESRKRRREKAKEEEESSARGGGKRIKKLPVRRKGNGNEESIVIEGNTNWEREMSVAEVLGERTDETTAVPVDQRHGDKEVPTAASPIEDTTPRKKPSKLKKQATPIKSKVEPTPPLPSKSTPQSKHKKFSDDFSDDVSQLPSSSAPAPGAEIQDSDDEEDSDDDAPEVVGKQDAQLNVRESAREAAKAAENLAAAQRQKRQDRDAQLKAQAADRKRKRGPELPTKINKSNLPLILPDEYLDDDSADERLSETDEVLKPKSIPSAGAKKMKFSQQIEKKPKDKIRADGAVLRVAEKKTQLLPPKVDKTTRNVKETWLMGRNGGKAGGKGGLEKRKMGGGFFVR